MGYVNFYIEAHIACILLIGLIGIKIAKGVNKQFTQMILGNIVVVLIAYYCAEIFWALVDVGYLGESKSLLYLSNLFTYLLLSVGAYLWYILSEAIQNDKSVENDITRLILSIPVWISGILCVSAYRTGLVYYIDENGKLVGGKLYLILVIVPFSYMIAASVKAFYRAFNKDKYADRNIYFMIGMFPLTPIVMGALQAKYWRIPMVCYGTVVAVYYVYITMLDNLISLDPLTQINNRHQMFKYLAQKMRNEEPGMSLFVLMVDIDDFRNINETYGRLEGDRALVRVANSIKSACQGPRNRFFVSRYGGDEFVVIAQMAYKAEAVWLSDQIKNNIKRMTQDLGLSYNITVSVGIAQYDYAAPISLKAFISRADLDLYNQAAKE
ncbi:MULTISPECIES: GGDEF domain-containing protein [unclassified Butyrivibrio]|uniref:GGDEF domain-containing protein n=1 Tax=unclassified Butyrivibrio TaxID=2639466 RepID=UPI0003B460FF|nr:MULTISPECIES: GGDEF domain-containing protein [unclassified Butyrivibrio]MDC7294034.1 GGDEF domain-containing protein [Butyrivibrio sp. DSM 10294]